MNDYSKRRVEKALDDLKYHEQELLACAVSEESFLKEKSDTEVYNSDFIPIEERVDSFWEALDNIRQACELLEVILNSGDDAGG